MPSFLRTIIAALALLVHVVSQGQPPQRSYQPTELRSDLDRLEQALRSKHPALFMYASAARIERCFDSLRNAVRRPMTELEFLSAISSIHPSLGDGHTLFLPSKADADREKRKLPFGVHWADGHLHIIENGSADERLFPGTAIDAINGIPVAAIMDTLMMRQIRDGRNTTYPLWILNSYFKEYYRFSFGQPDSFRLKVRSSAGDDFIVVRALPSDSIRVNIAMRSLSHDKQAADGFGIRYGPEGAAILRIPSFERGSFTANQLDEAFEELRAKRTQALIIDLRGNQGGEPMLAKRLLAHLLDKPFELVLHGPASGVTRPRRVVFAGDVTALMDGGSFSVTGMVLSCLERHGRATFVGEEAGGNRTVLAGSPKRITMPHTRIECYISTRLWQLADRPNDGHGVMPTIAVRPTIDDLLNGRDPVMQAALDRLRSR